MSDHSELVERLEDEREEAKDCSRVGTPWDPITAQRIANTMFCAAAALTAADEEIASWRRTAERLETQHVADAAEIARLRDAEVSAWTEIERLREALAGLEFFYAREGENNVDRFERVAEQFYRETGIIAPGKDASPLSDQPEHEERRRLYDAWTDARVKAARAALGEKP